MLCDVTIEKYIISEDNKRDSILWILRIYRLGYLNVHFNIDLIALAYHEYKLYTNRTCAKLT